VERWGRQAFTVADRLRRAVKDVRWSPSWSRAEANPAQATPVVAPIYAVIGTYNEADVIEASVRNAFVQGAERVYLVDNASTDDTVDRAVAAGAILAERFSTQSFEESVRCLLMNGVVWRVSQAESAEHIWWWWIDADEFSHGPQNLTIADYLSRLDGRFRVVGADVYRHFPDTKPEYIPGFHPLEFQPLCELFRQPSMPRCRLLHHKHPLQRFDRSGPFITSARGYHECEPNDRRALIEPAVGIVTHHFQFREESVTRRRLDEVYGPQGGRGETLRHFKNLGGLGRLESADAVYSQRWAEVDNQHHIVGDVGVHLRPWQSFSGWSVPLRWYGEDELILAISSKRP